MSGATDYRELQWVLVITIAAGRTSIRPDPAPKKRSGQAAPKALPGKAGLEAVQHRGLDRAAEDRACAQQQAYLADFWAHADVEIAGDDALQQGIRFNQFHLLQSVGRDGRTNIAAKGVTGEGYEGRR
jgi:hypothetical protein